MSQPQIVITKATNGYIVQEGITKTITTDLEGVFDFLREKFEPKPEPDIIPAAQV